MPHLGQDYLRPNALLLGLFEEVDMVLLDGDMVHHGITVARGLADLQQPAVLQWKASKPDLKLTVVERIAFAGTLDAQLQPAS